MSGAVTLVARRGRIVHFEAQGLMDIESKKPMMKDSIFRLASMSKPITAVAVMMMVEEGKIRLTDRVSAFIPEFKNMKVAVAKGTTNPVQMPAFGTRRAAGAGAGVRSRAGRARDHGEGSPDAHVRVDERRRQRRRAGEARAPRPERHAGELHSEARADSARLPAGHAVALQRSLRLRRPRAHRRDHVGPAVRSVPQAAHLRSARDERHRLRADARADGARRDRLPADAEWPACPRRTPTS